ncbi:hypothetical protein ABTY96_12330 [Streptomyces sp. NPDC096057]|uniref:hypothetical protein n=1 Tax=Streptomyces sp. NPDC096057 TaxID=3155543 RepID=UPI003319E86D
MLTRRPWVARSAGIREVTRPSGVRIRASAGERRWFSIAALSELKRSPRAELLHFTPPGGPLVRRAR